MADFPSSGFLRLKQIIGDPSADPPIAPILPIGRSTLLKAVQEGRFPAPVRLGPRITAWRIKDIWAWAENPQAYASERIQPKSTARSRSPVLNSQEQLETPPSQVNNG